MSGREPLHQWLPRMIPFHCLSASFFPYFIAEDNEHKFAGPGVIPDTIL